MPSQPRLLLALLWVASAPLSAQLQQPTAGRAAAPRSAVLSAAWSFGGEAITAPGALFGAGISLRVAQWQRSRLDAFTDQFWRSGDVAPTACAPTCPPPRAIATRATSYGLRFTTELEGPFYGVATASLTDAAWAEPDQSVRRGGRFGFGTGYVLGPQGDALELRVEAMETPLGRKYGVAMGYRRLPPFRTVSDSVRMLRALGAPRERTFRSDVRRTFSQMQRDANGSSATSSGRVGVAPNLAVRQRLLSYLSAEVGAGIVDKGAAGNNSLRITYAELPVIANLELSPASARWQWFAGAGIAPALLLRCSESNVSFSGDRWLPCRNTQLGGNTPQRFSNFDLSQELRFGTRIKLGAGRIVGTWSLSRSLIDVNTAGPDGERNTHRVASWGIGYERSY